MGNRIGKKTIEFSKTPYIKGYAAVGSKMEKEGPLCNKFDYIFDDPLAGKKSWEQAESELQNKALTLAVKKAGILSKDVDVVFAGDLLNQCIASTFGLQSFKIPLVGLYGACSTMALSIIMASVAVEAGFCGFAAAVTSSHFCSAERQYRFPLEYGGVRPPTAQWTVTGSGAVLLTNQKNNIKITKAIIGTVEDLGVKDSNNMGAAMAPDDVKIRPYPLGVDG